MAGGSRDVWQGAAVMQGKGRALHEHRQHEQANLYCRLGSATLINILIKDSRCIIAYPQLF